MIIRRNSRPPNVESGPNKPGPSPAGPEPYRRKDLPPSAESAPQKHGPNPFGPEPFRGKNPPPNVESGPNKPGPNPFGPEPYRRKDPPPNVESGPRGYVPNPNGPEPYRLFNPQKVNSGATPDTVAQDPAGDLRKQLADAAETAAQKAKAVQDAVNQGLGADEVKKRTEEWKKAQQTVIDLTDKLIAEMEKSEPPQEPPKGATPADKPGTGKPGTEGGKPATGPGGTKVGEKPVGLRPPKVEDVLARILQQALESRIPGYDQLQNIRKIVDLARKFMSGEITPEQLQNDLKAMGLTLKSLPNTLAELKKQVESGKPPSEQEVFDKLRKAFLEDLQNPEVKGVSKETLDALTKALDAEAKKIGAGGKPAGPVQGGGAEPD
ncbi:MAG: hypothetical protein ACRD8O_23230, partial [Bryobacteraceae bacterium]